MGRVLMRRLYASDAEAVNRETVLHGVGKTAEDSRTALLPGSDVITATYPYFRFNRQPSYASRCAAFMLAKSGEPLASFGQSIVSTGTAFFPTSASLPRRLPF